MSITVFVAVGSVFAANSYRIVKVDSTPVEVVNNDSNEKQYEVYESKTKTESVSKSEKTVYITPYGEKYHKSSCKYVQESGSAINYSDAMDRGYTACKVCKP